MKKTEEELKAEYERTHCQRPDRHVPGLVCGYPLPCPYHTVIIDLTKKPTTVEVPVTAKEGIVTLERVKQIARALSDED